MVYSIIIHHEGFQSYLVLDDHPQEYWPRGLCRPISVRPLA